VLIGEAPAEALRKIRATRAAKKALQKYAKNVHCSQILFIPTEEKMCTVKIIKSTLIATDMLLKIQRVEMGHRPASEMVWWG